MSERYTLDDLTRAADVTVRTVRYYIAEGLLPPPMGGGRAARYTPEHLDRLVIISALKERHLPLKEIGAYLHQLSADDIAHAAAEIRNGEPATPQATMLARRLTETPALVAERFSHDLDEGDDDVDATAANPTRSNVSHPGRTVADTAPALSSPLEPEPHMLREEPGEPFDALAYIRSVRHTPPLQRPALRHPAPRLPSPDPHDPQDHIAWRRLRIGAEAELLIADAPYRRHRRDIDDLIAEVRRIIET